MELQPGTICVCIGNRAQIDAAFADWMKRGVLATSERLDRRDIARLITDDAPTLLPTDAAIDACMQHMLTARAHQQRMTFLHHPDVTKQQLDTYIQIAKQQHVPIVALHFHDGHPPTHVDALYTYSPHMPIKRAPSPFILPLGQGLDVIGDIHGCFDEMITLIEQLGYVKEGALYMHKDGRKLVSLGDVMSRGPKSLQTLQFWQQHVAAGRAYMTDSNHGDKIGRWLAGNDVTLAHGDEFVAEEFANYEQQYGSEQTAVLKQQLATFLLAAPSHYVVTDNNVPIAVLTHAGIKDHYIQKESKRIRQFCRYGDVDGIDAAGKPIRKQWYTDHHIDVPIIWGHVPHMEPTFLQHTINIDQGVVFGGQLTAYRLPEHTYISVRAQQNYVQHADNPITVLQQQRVETVDPAPYAHGFTVETAQKHIAVTKQAAQHALAQQIPLLSPLPMLAPPPTASQHANFLQHPDDVFAYYAKRGVTKLVMQQHVNGHRALIFVAKTADVTQQFIGHAARGRITTMHGERFFTDDALEDTVLARIHTALQPYFVAHKTSYVLFEAIIAPFSIRDADKLKQHETEASEALVTRTAAFHTASPTSKPLYRTRLQDAARFEAMLHNYRWPVNEKTIQIAPLQLVAHNARTYTDAHFSVHAAFIDELTALHSMFIASPYRVVETASQQVEAVKWWEQLGELGHVGVIMKPFHVAQQLPTFVVEGREYLRLRYGIDYTSTLAALKKAYRTTVIKHATSQQLLFGEWVLRFVRYESATAMYPYALASLALHEQKERQ